jgi:hypothetical protein
MGITKNVEGDKRSGDLFFRYCYALYVYDILMTEIRRKMSGMVSDRGCMIFTHRKLDQKGKKKGHLLCPFLLMSTF